MVVKVGPFCRKGLSPQANLVRRANETASRYWRFTCTEVAASRKVLPGRQDLPKSPTTPWSKIEAARDWTTLSAGCYLLRTNVTDWSDEELWKAYIQLTEVGAAFRIHKSDLSIRPIWHQKEERVLAHIFVCFLAYVLWKTLGQLCDEAGLGSEPRRVLSELAEIRSMDVVLPTRSGMEIRTRCISKPTDHQQILLEKLRRKLPSKTTQKKM